MARTGFDLGHNINGDIRPAPPNPAPGKLADWRRLHPQHMPFLMLTHSLQPWLQSGRCNGNLTSAPTALATHICGAVQL